MREITEIIYGKDEYIAGNGTSEQQIAFAEEQLGVKFAPEYKKYLSQFGVVSFDGREFTGITPIKRLDVVSVTNEERSRAPVERKKLYVIEQTNVDDVVFWQDSDGVIYSTYGIGIPRKEYNSLSEFLSQ